MTIITEYMTILLSSNTFLYHFIPIIKSVSRHSSPNTRERETIPHLLM